MVTLGNHTLKHLNHSQNNLESFKEDVMMNDFLICSLSKNKPLNYFRFPFNATGKDSLCQKERYDYLKSKNYISTPFTIESSDYIFNTLYCHELDLGNKKRADSIAECYLQLTINLFNQMEKNSMELFGRNISHIYLCHANKLNADYYSQLIQRIKSLDYSIISIKEALNDKIYESKEYFVKSGISWIYRWIPNEFDRKKYLRSELEIDPKLFEEYNKLINTK